MLELFRRRGVQPDVFLEALRELYLLCEHITPTGEPPFCRDEDDRKYLHCALAGRLVWLVSRDRDLLDLERVGQTTILPPEDLLVEAEAQGMELDP